MATRNRTAEDSHLQPFQPDITAHASEVMPDSGPQLAYSDEPELLSDWSEKEALLHENATPKDHQRHPLGWSTRKRPWVVARLLVAVFIAIAVGAKIRVSSSNRWASPQAPSTAPWPLTSDFGLKHGIFNDSSFAAVSALDGSMFLFYQDISGALRQASYSKQSWTTDTSLIIPNTTDARNNTPLAATIQTLPDGSNEIYLFYILTNNNLSARRSTSGKWATPEETSYVNLSGYQANPDSRALAVNTVPATHDIELLLIFEESGGNVTVLHGTKTSPNTDLIGTLTWSWECITTKLGSSWYPSKLSAPFSLTPGPNFNNTPEGLGLQVVLYDADKQKDPVYVFDNGTFIYAPCYNIPHLTFPRATDIVQPFMYIPGTNRMISPYGFWVNGTQPQWLWAKYTDEPRDTPLPQSPFLYARLATATPVGSPAFYLFHQLDARTFVQDVFDQRGQIWRSFYVSVETE